MIAVVATGASFRLISAAATGSGTSVMRSPTRVLSRVYRCSTASPVADRGSTTALTIPLDAFAATNPNHATRGPCRHGPPPERSQPARRYRLAARDRHPHRDAARALDHALSVSRRSPLTSAKAPG